MTVGSAIAMTPLHDYNYSMRKDWTGSNNPRWNGGKRTLTNGYVMVRADPDKHSVGKDGYILEHRLVMENALGRKLLKGEVVHHQNHVVGDNRLENLELYTSHAEHMADNHHNHIPPRKLILFTKCKECQRSDVKASTTDLCHNCYMRAWNRKKGIVKSL